MFENKKYCKKKLAFQNGNIAVNFLTYGGGGYWNGENHICLLFSEIGKGQYKINNSNYKKRMNIELNGIN